MRTNIRLTLAVAALALTTAAFAQRSNSSYFTEGNAMRHNLNPAFDGEYNYVSIPALGNVNIGMKGNFGIENVLFTNNAGKLSTYLHPDIQWSDIESGLKANNKIRTDINMQILGAGFKAWGGYNTVGLNVRSFIGANVPLEIFEMTKNLQNQNYSISNLNMRAQAWAELAFGHSRSINNWRVGGKFKLLFGSAQLDASLKDLQLNIADPGHWSASGEATIEANLKNWAWETETKEYEGRKNAAQQPATYETVTDVSEDYSFSPMNGMGIAFDLGAEYDFKDVAPGLKLSFALLDLGFIKWSNNVVAKNNGTPFDFYGFSNVQVNDGPGTSLEDQTNQLLDDFTDLFHMKDLGDEGGKAKGLGATMNFGAEYALPQYKPLRFGFLSTTRIQGKYTWNEERFSANISPLKWLEGNINFGVGSFGADFGWMLNIHPKGYNFFIAMDHILGKTSKQLIPLSSQAQLSMGMSVTW
ncbi:MAG: DUF5723 family protein [Bacteroidaceae bacterium]|nr:DUF5723 family protein [Bacteroidaceae bacterium]